MFHTPQRAMGCERPGVSRRSQQAHSGTIERTTSDFQEEPTLSLKAFQNRLAPPGALQAQAELRNCAARLTRNDGRNSKVSPRNPAAGVELHISGGKYGQPSLSSNASGRMNSVSAVLFRFGHGLQASPHRAGHGATHLRRGGYSAGYMHHQKGHSGDMDRG